MRTCGATVLTALLLVGGCTPSRELARTEVGTAVAHEGLNATLWMQQSAEYRATALQAYGTAGVRLREALSDTSWSAIPSQRQAGMLPPAVILDVDETVLDNSPFQARLVVLDTVYTRDLWNEWVLERRARPVPGALDFTRAADAAGVRIFYVTNRTSELEEATRDNLRAAGFPVGEGFDAVLTRGERLEWTGDKSSRRDMVASEHRVLLLVGDDLNDFVPADQLDVGERAAVVETLSEMWGTRWIVLPNPGYGSWERAVTRTIGARSRADQIHAKKKALETR